mgnify:CR=1 FL=1
MAARTPVFMLGRTEPSETMKYRDIRTDRSGGIEGLPLQLMIVILVATMGTAIIVGWMGNIEAPHAIGDVETPGPIIDASGGTMNGFYVEGPGWGLPRGCRRRVPGQLRLDGGC